MKIGERIVTRTSILLALAMVGLMVVLAILPFAFKSVAGGQKNSERHLSKRTVSEEDGIGNYDIRTNKSKSDVLYGFRLPARKSAVEIADVRDRFVVGENLLREKVPTLKIEYNEDIRIPEVIAPDVEQEGRAFLTEPSNAKRSSVLRQFISDNNNLIGVEKAQVKQLKTTADYTNPDGNLSYAHLEQTINGIPVFRGEIKAGFTHDGAMFRVINNLAPGLDYAELSTDFGDPFAAVQAAAANVNYELKESELNQNYADSNDLKAVFGTGDWATTAEKMYFPIEPGVARTAWRVLIWKPTNAYYVIVDAETGALLWRKNISADQTQSATYNVYTNPANMLNVANNPAPIVPGLNTPNTGTQGALISRSNVALTGNEAPNTFNNLGWITDGANGANGFTDGNNVQAGLDIDGTNGVDAPVSGTSRVFNFAYIPNTDSPTLPAFRNGAVTQLFYTTNRYHDETYKLGFTEAARNFQNDNFGRGGTANDRVSAEAQDSSGTSNANFAAGADGTRGRMQMYIFNGPNPDRDGDLDNDVVVHELTHGLSNRLVGNNSGLNTNRAGSMGEGWSDFYGLALLSNPSDPLAANYATGGYATYLLTANYTYNYYYGIRRFPYAIKSFTGGPNNRPHNPLTFADIDPNQINLSDGAFAANPVFAANSATEVHNAGEVWCSALWEFRAQLITRLGAANGNLKSLQLVTDGLKLTPNSPNFIQARDAIIAAANANSAADAADVREGFRIRGMGFEAQDNGTSVVESFDVLNVKLTDPFSVSDAPGDNDGFPEPGESVLLSVAITNTTGATVDSVAANVNGGTNVAYGSIANGAIVTMQIPYTIPAGAACGSLHSVTINVSSVLGTQAPQTRSFRIGTPIFGGATQNFDGVTAPALPVGWTQTNSSANTGWVTTTVNAVSAPNSVFAPDPAASGEATLETSANITSASAQLSFSNRFSTENGYDGSVLEIKIGGGVYQDILAAGGSFVSGGYTRALLGGTSLGTRQAWTGSNGTGFTTLVNLPAAANGQTIGLRWRTVSDVDTSVSGTWYDNMQLTGGSFQIGYLCNIPINLVVTTAADTNDGMCDSNCSLREALDAADGDGAFNTITFNIPANSANCVGANCTITLTSPLAPSADGGFLTTINGGTGANAITLSGNGATQILSVGSGVNLAANNLNFTRGANSGSGANGGAIGNSGTLTLTNSAIYNNSAQNGGAVATVSGSVTNLTNVTVSGNSASQFGGGIYNGATVTATNCTITNNSAVQFGGGVITFNNTNFNIRNTIIAGNSASLTPDANGNFTSNGYNLVGNASGANGFTATGDQTGINAMLAPLGNNGGKTLTHALLTGSPAIDKGNSFGVIADQRGFTRPIDLPSANFPNVSGGDGADIGAFEVQALVNEADVQTRPGGDGFVDSDDIQQIRLFSVGTGLPYQSNEFQRADCSPRSTMGDGFVDGDDVQQARRYSVGTDPKQFASGPASRPAPAQDNLTDKVGDLSFGTLPFSSPSFRLFDTSIGKALAGPAAFRIDNQNTGAGQTLVVPIRVDTVGNEAGYTFSIAYDATKLTNPSVTIGNGGGDVVFNADTPGQIGFSVTSFPGGTIAAANNVILVNVTFTVATNAPAGTTAITFTDTPARRKASGTDPNTPLAQPSYTGGTINIGAPTAAAATIGGRVLTANDRGLANATVNLTDQSGSIRTTRTNPFGYYRFETVGIGQTYILSVQSKRFQFPAQVINVFEDLSELNFYSNSEGLQ